ncbi:MAG: DUF2914 domain-containing protein [Fidelibacterota bacterium]
MKEKSGMWFAFLGIGLVLLLPIHGDLLGQGAVSVNKIVIAKDVSDRTPVEPGTEFTSDVGELYCFTAVNNPGDPVTITHVWSHEGEVRSRVDMTIGTSPNWRAWSVKTISPEWTGSWTVSVVDAAGSEIASTDFAVTGMEMAPEAPEAEEVEMPQPEAPEMEEAPAPPEEPVMPEPEAVEEEEMAPEEEAVPAPEAEAEPDTAAGE